MQYEISLSKQMQDSWVVAKSINPSLLVVPSYMYIRLSIILISPGMYNNVQIGNTRRFKLLQQ